MLWVDAMYLLAKGCSWFAAVHGYKVSFIPTECFIRKKLMFRLILQSSSEHTQHAQNTAV